MPGLAPSVAFRFIKSGQVFKGAKLPTRLLREGILTSERIKQLDFAEEVFYRRLMSKVDDHGLYDANPSILRPMLYPLKVDRVREADISRWMAACQKAGLIVLYEAGGKNYLKMLDTKWEARSAAKYPLPTVNNGKQVLTTVPLDVVVDVVVVEENLMSSSAEKPPNIDDPPTRKKPKKPRKTVSSELRAQAVEVLEFLNKRTDHSYRPTDATLEPIVSRLSEGNTVSDSKAVIVRRWRKWKDDPKMAEFLRPATLFAAKNFAQYVGEVPTEGEL